MPYTYDPLAPFKAGSSSNPLADVTAFPFGAQQTGAWWNQPLTNQILGSGLGAVPTTSPGTNPSTTPGTPSAAGGFNLNPTPHTGQGVYGLVPGPLGLPNPAGDLQAQIPGLQGLNTRASGVINSYLGGELPADVQAQIQDAAAQFGVATGMPGSGLVRNRTARDLGLTSLDLTNKGLAAYGPFVGAVSGTQTVSPALQAQIAEQNAVNAAAPDPTAAQSHAEALYREYLNSLARTGNSNIRGPQSGTGQYSLPQMNRYTGSGYGGGYNPAANQFSVAPALSYGANPSTTPISAPNPTYGSYGGFDTFLNDALGVPDIYADQGPPFPYAPDYTGSYPGSFDTFLNDSLGSSFGVVPNELDYLSQFGFGG